MHKYMQTEAGISVCVYERESVRARLRDKYRQREREKERERERQRQRQRDRGREAERETERERQRDRETERQADTRPAPLAHTQWMAPEVIANVLGQQSVYDRSVDVYSFGVLLWELFHCQVLSCLALLVYFCFTTTLACCCGSSFTARCSVALLY
jgi:hypothetical protein